MPPTLGDQCSAAILAAGLGRRLEPLTVHHLPKPMFPLGGRTPIVEGWVRTLVTAGITDVSMNLCVLPETLRRHFGDGTALGANLGYVEEEVPSGTLGGACRQAFDGAGRRGSTLIVPSGDIVTNFGSAEVDEMYELHKRSGAACSMILVPVPWERRRDYGTVLLESPESRPGSLSKAGPIEAFYEKDPDSPSNLNNASIYMLEMDLLAELDRLRTPADLGLDRPFYDFGKHVFPAMLGLLRGLSLSREYPLWGIEYDGAWFDVGQKRDYLRVNEEALAGRLTVAMPYEVQDWGYLGEDSELDAGRVHIEPPVVVGDGCVIEPGARLGPYAVIGDGWRVANGATIRHSVLWPRYPFFGPSGREIPIADRLGLDAHRVGPGVVVEESIVAGGDLTTDARESTVEVLADGRNSLRPIDWVPDQPRA